MWAWWQPGQGCTGGLCSAAQTGVTEQWDPVIPVSTSWQKGWATQACCRWREAGVSVSLPCGDRTNGGVTFGSLSIGIFWEPCFSSWWFEAVPYPGDSWHWAVWAVEIGTVPELFSQWPGRVGGSDPSPRAPVDSCVPSAKVCVTFQSPDNWCSLKEYSGWISRVLNSFLTYK